MALTTQISKNGKWRRDTVRVWFGHQVPEGVIAIELEDMCMWDELRVRWKTKHEIHEMPFEETDEGITAVLVAMKLTC